MPDDISRTRKALNSIKRPPCYLFVYCGLRPVRPLIKKHYQPVPEQIRNRGEDRKSLRFVPARFSWLVPGYEKREAENVVPANTGTGYLNLPPELRNRIMEHSMVTESIWPYKGEDIRENWLRDVDIASAAHSQAFRFLLRHPSPRRIGIFEALRPNHRHLIRSMILEISVLDLTLDAIDDIEAQLRAKDIAHGRLPPDRSKDDWVAPVVYNILCSWRTKLAWLREWTWLEQVTICSSRGPWPPHDLVYFKGAGSVLPRLLKSVGPVEVHGPMLDCYGECAPTFAVQMRRMEADL
ncbi:MAG: hypothetical protein LQ346_003121 [Caloplaca aetnensis]|nr:MAG: hypothetical protein LQ346_003121 [Caloplaca aetnensis]